MEKGKTILKQKIVIKGYEKYPKKEDVIPVENIPQGYTKYGEKLFDSPDEAWFWFMKYEKLKDYFTAYKPVSIWAVPRPCTVNDIYIIVKRLYKEKIITTRELKVMIKYGDLGYSPDCYNKKQQPDWGFWETAMDKLYSVLYKKGIVMPKKYTYN